MPKYQEEESVKKRLLKRGVEHYVGRVRPKDKEITILLNGHLLIEYLLNKIIEKKCKSPKQILDYRFSVKLQVVCSMGLLPDNLYDNIKTVNTLRNDYVHTLDFNLDKKIKKIKVHENETISFDEEQTAQTYLWALCIITLAQLDTHMREVLQIDTRYFSAARKKGTK